MADSTINGREAEDPEVDADEGAEAGDGLEGEDGGSAAVEGAGAGPTTAGGKKSKKKKGKGKLKQALTGQQPKLEDKMTDELQQTIVEKVRYMPLPSAMTLILM